MVSVCRRWRRGPRRKLACRVVHGQFYSNFYGILQPLLSSDLVNDTILRMKVI